MKITEKELQGLLPNLRGLPNIDPRVDTRINEAMRRVYEFFLVKLNEQEKDYENKLKQLADIMETKFNNISNLVGVLTTPLVGSGNNDPILQSVVSSYGPQSPNSFLAGPAPSFRAITLADLPPGIPAGPATQLNANGTILDVDDILAGEYLKRVGNSIQSDFPVGTTNLGDGTLPNAEGTLYTTPALTRTKIRTIILYNNTAGALTAHLIIKDNAAAVVWNNDFPLLSGERIAVTLNIKLDAAWILNGYTSAVGAIEYSIFGIEEPL